MTESTLSPAAKAVKDAAQDAYWLWDSMCPADAEAIASAAIRAAANDWRIDTEFIGGVEYIRTSTLDKIADELEGK
tara:strand:- start:382 stop:609 length:228 start_codon:yes stop_codon:yes gene_type:complete